MRARYWVTSSREVTRPSLRAAWISVIEALATLKGDVAVFCPQLATAMHANAAAATAIKCRALKLASRMIIPLFSKDSTRLASRLIFEPHARTEDTPENVIKIRIGEKLVERIVRRAARCDRRVLVGEVPDVEGRLCPVAE